MKNSAHLLVRFGGHPSAAGLALNPSDIPALRKALSRSIDALWDSTVASPGLQIDAYVSLDELSLELVTELERLAPFGPGNPPVQLATLNLEIIEDVLVGRQQEHRRLVVGDERGTHQTVLWWHGADQKLPQGRIDLAYTLRARDYRGDLQLQVEWLDARRTEPLSLPPARPSRTIIDWRGLDSPRQALEGLKEEISLVWMEGEDATIAKEIGGAERSGLTRSPVLIIWTAPPGPVELVQALEVVNPSKVYLLAVEPATTSLQAFMERLVGTVKYDLRTRGGRIDLARTAGTLGHREATVRLGLQWLSVRGQVHILEEGGNSLTLGLGGKPTGRWQGIETRVRRMLEETAAYRRHFRSAPVEILGISDQ